MTFDQLFALAVQVAIAQMARNPAPAPFTTQEVATAIKDAFNAVAQGEALVRAVSQAEPSPTR